MEGFLTESHIVVIGDDPMSLRQVEQVLHTDGYRRVSLTTDLQRSQDFVTGHEPDLVLLDLAPPHFRGLELVQSLRGQVAADSFVPIVMLTTELAGVERRQALKAGANDLLTKPLDLEELSLRVARLLDTRRLIVTLQRERAMLASMVADQTAERNPEAGGGQRQARTTRARRTSSSPV
jgi:DNA-binding response OmpR family regulator